MNTPREASSRRELGEAELRVPQTGEFRRAIISGVVWKGTSQVMTQVTRFGVTIVLARLLAPHQYGIAGMVLVFASFILIFSDFALGPTLVQREGLTHEETCTAFWTSIASGTVFTLIGIAVASPIASFFKEPTLTPMIMVLSTTFFVQAVGLTQSALLIRAMEFRSLELRQIVATVGGGIVGILVALGGHGAWAIIWQQFAVACLSTILVWRYSSWRPGRYFSFRSLRSFAGFTSNVLGTTLAGQIRGNADNLLVGRVLGAAALGSYGLAYNLVLVPSNRIAVPLSQVLFPALSRLQNDFDRLTDSWRRALQIIGAIAIPASVGLAILAPEFVGVVLGQKWRAAVPIIRLLAVVGLLQTLQFLTLTVLQAVAKTGVALRLQVAKTVACVAAFAIGLHWGVTGVAAAYAVVTVVVEPLSMYLAARAVAVPFGDLLRALSGVTQAGALMGVTLVALRELAIHVGIPESPRLAALVVAGILIFWGAIRWRAPELGLEFNRLRGRRRSRSRDTLDDEPAMLAPSQR